MKLNIETLKGHPSGSLSLVFLHGFTGSAEDWSEISQGIDSEFAIYAIDLPGHGRSESPDNLSFYSADAINLSVKETLDTANLKKIILIGYSMGGRAALNFSINYPEYVHALILESATAGISDFEDRVDRIKNDEKISAMILSSSIEKFIDYWMSIPLFDSQKFLPKEKLEKIRRNKLRNNKLGLSNSLKGFGTGSMPVLWNELKKIKCPVLLITGEYDKKFTAISVEMTSRLSNVKHFIAPGCGHNVHLERPEHFLNLTNKFISKISTTY